MAPSRRWGETVAGEVTKVQERGMAHERRLAEVERWSRSWDAAAANLHLVMGMATGTAERLEVLAKEIEELRRGTPGGVGVGSVASASASTAGAVGGGSCFADPRLLRLSASTVLMFRSDNYFVPLTSPASQLKRWLTDVGFHPLDRNTPHVEHLQVLRIGNFTALAAAEADALDEDWRVVHFDELPGQNWKKLLLQMLSSGSVGLLRSVAGGDLLTGLEERDVWQLLDMFSEQERGQLAANICDALGAIRSLVGNTRTPLELGEWDASGSPTLLPPLADRRRERSLLPRADVLDELFPGGFPEDSDRSLPHFQSRSASVDDFSSDAESLDLRAAFPAN